MAQMERLRDDLTTPPEPEYWGRRIGEGWRMVGVVRDRPAAAGEAEAIRRRAELPYGLRVAADCLHLEENPVEMTIADGLAPSRGPFRARPCPPEAEAWHGVPSPVRRRPRCRRERNPKRETECRGRNRATS